MPRKLCCGKIRDRREYKREKRGLHLSTITLYHGTSYDFDCIDLQYSRPYKDFGKGFYATADINHARSMAERNVEMRMSKLQLQNLESDVLGKRLYEYRFDMDKASRLLVKEFTEAGREWGLFVTSNRNSRDVSHKYDIVFGPTANDYTNPTIQFYLSGGVGEVGSDAAIDELVRLLMPFKLPSQYYFATQQAIDCLTLTRKELF